MARTVLGRGLSALIPSKNLEIDLKQIPVEQINPNPNQPRNFVEDDSFKELVVSVKQFGVLQPLVVKEQNGGFEIIAGERRFRAAKEAGVRELPAVVKKIKNEVEGFEMALIENLQREDLSPLEEAGAFRYLLDDCRISQDKLAKHLGKSRSYIANSVRLLNLEEQVQRFIEEGDLSASHARALVTLEPSRQRLLANKVVQQGLSVRQVEFLASDRRAGGKTERASAADFSVLEKQLSEKIGAKVKIKSRDNQGRVEIYFADAAELEKIKEKLLAQGEK